MKPNDFLNPEMRKIILKQQEMLKPFNETTKIIREQNKIIDENDITKKILKGAGTNKFNVSNPIFSYLDTNLATQNFKIAKNIENNININIPKFTDSYNEVFESYKKTMNVIYENNAFLANSISRTIEVAKINNPVLNNQIFTDLQNTFSITGLDFSKTVLKEFTNSLKSYNDEIIKNQKKEFNIVSDKYENLSKNEVNQNGNYNEFDDVLNLIDNQSTPFSENKLKKIFLTLLNIYEFSLRKINDGSKFTTASISSNLIIKCFNENIFKSDVKELFWLLISIIVYLVSNKLIKIKK